MKWVSERRFLHFIEDIKNIFARKDEVPKKLSELENDIGAGVGDGGMFEEKDPTVPSWAKHTEKPIYTASEVGADASGTAESKVTEHNVATDAHSDIRLLVEGLTSRLNALADSDDTTLDQMSEVVDYIKSNKSLIDAITTSKVSVTDIIDNLITNVSNKPLSAAQGVALKALIDTITTVELDETLSDNTKAAPAGMVGKLKGDLAGKVPNTDYAPELKTDFMTQPVGKDSDGKLWTAPGSGGSGIAVTGATVGQTVKIAAVDDDGVPTAWESVDFPSGGLEFELVEHCLLEEDSGLIELTFSKEYKKLYFAIKLVNGSTGTNIGVITFPAIDANNRQYYFSSQASVTKCHAFYIECGIGWRTAYGKVGYGNSLPPISDSGDQAATNASIAISNRNIPADSRSMNGIKFIGTKFAIGTEIYVYGIPL